MIPQDKNQPGPAGVVKMFGHPWHGLVEDGTLTLPNAATMPYPAPTAAGEADVLAFVVPGTPAVVRTPAQAAADAAAGRQWLDYALISGRTTRRLYGQPIGGNGSWLYAAPDGSRWLATLAGVPGTHDLTAPWSTTVTFDRFGAFGTPPEQHVLAVTLADWQQSVAGKPGGDWFIFDQGDVTSGQITVEDVDRSGGQAILMVSLSMPNEPILRRSLGFLLVTLTGLPGVDAGATLGVLRSRAATLGTVVDNLEGPLNFPLTHIFPENRPTLDVRVFAGSAIYHADVVGRIIAMAFDAAGAARALELTCTNTNTTIYNAPTETALPMTGSGSQVLAAAVHLSWGGGGIDLEATITEGLVETIVGSTLTRTTTVNVDTPLGGYSTSSSSTQRGLEFSVDIGYFSVNRRVMVGFPISPAISDADGFRADVGDLGDTQLAFIKLMLQRCSHRLIDVIVQEVGAQWHYWGGLSPDALAGSVIAVASQHPYGSAHPVTGEIARVSELPVCWV